MTKPSGYDEWASLVRQDPRAAWAKLRECDTGEGIGEIGHDIVHYWTVCNTDSIQAAVDKREATLRWAPRSTYDKETGLFWLLPEGLMQEPAYERYLQLKPGQDNPSRLAALKQIDEAISFKNYRDVPHLTTGDIEIAKGEEKRVESFHE
ncbi:hypothetical protein K469DRAFT_689215 [Zopfia rhizophila CBS 207.26]|uniref:Uncharacterized protein n=1 Tax=Zopfia rhizophila CBS 207.26 TaxID=1314779 RepID=A0A6A6ET60_9PEZI|nr:hypothetical protein K469DRAFT_689215 [Zopfia rhizophila CBS 207.26]